VSAVRRLRAETAAAHEAVDAAYGGFALADPVSYAAFLRAHARALPAVEQALAGWALPTWRPRTEALAADLADLGVPAPEPYAMSRPGEAAAAWGMLYVIEGSRLGGAMLERQVAAGLPRRYLASRHLPGEWRALLAALDAAATDDAWTERAVTAARATFDLYGRAASHA
jgi:heme oxygenase (biliverdin-IX-beta and delta-forming)